MAKTSYLTSGLLDRARIAHGWFTRSGGVSQEPFDSLNVKHGFADPGPNVEENRRRALVAMGLNKKDLVFIKHEHTGRILHAADSDRGKDIFADAAVSTEQGIILGQGTADCGTIVLAAKDNQAIGLIHASWRTLREGIVKQTAGQVASMAGVAPEKLLAAIGPLACAKCYEFGEEAEKLFDTRYVVRRADKRYVDLRAMIQDQLAAAGVEQIDDTGVCTIEDPRFFSHRRDKDKNAQCGRFLTLVVAK